MPYRIGEVVDRLVHIDDLPCNRPVQASLAGRQAGQLSPQRERGRRLVLLVPAPVVPAFETMGQPAHAQAC
jgi:hypothetical protein